MTSHAPEPEPNQERIPKPNKKFRILLGLTIGFVVALGGGLGYARYYIFQKLSPQIERQLAKNLNRPLNLGAVQSFSLNGVRLGYSELPATQTENDQVLLESLVVNYNLWALVTKRQLHLNLTLINPQVYIEQDGDRQWFALDFQRKPPKEGDVEVTINTVEVRRGQLTLVARKPSGTLQRPIQLNVSYAQGKFSDRNRVINFDAKGDLAAGGALEVSGETNIQKNTIELDLRAKKTNIAVVTDLVPLPLTLVDGLVDGSLAMYFKQGNLLSWQGGVVTQNVTVQLPQLAKPIVGINSKISFEKKQLQLNKLSGTLGDILLSGDLLIDLQKGLGGKLVTAPVEIAKLFKTFNIAVPTIPLKGELKGLVSFSGGLDKPQLLIEAVNNKALMIDRLSVDQFRGTIAIIGNQFLIDRFVAIPTLGGEVTGRGIIQLATKAMPTGAIAVAATGTNLPSNALAQLYGVSVPVTLGRGKTEVIVEAPLNKPDQFLVTGTAVVPVAGGIITATNLKITKDVWQTPAKAEGLRLAQLTTQTLPSFLQRGIVNGDFLASGAFQHKDRKPLGPPLEVTGEARTRFAGGQAIARNIKVNDNKWLADVALAGLDLRQLAPNVPKNLVASYGGNFRAGGSLENVSTQTVEVLGSGQLTVGQGVIRTKDVAIANGEWYSRAELDNVNLVSFAPQLGSYDKTVATQGTFEVKGTLENLTLEGILAQGSAQANFASGTVNAGLITLRNGKLNGEFTAKNVDLAVLSKTLKGVGSGTAQIVADLNQPNLKNIQAQGNLTLSQGVSLITSALQSRWAWNGKQLQIQEAIAQGFRADGVLDINSDRLGKKPLEAITKIALNLTAQNLDLAELPLPQAAQDLKLKGQGSFIGTVQGTLQQPTINGQLALNQGQVGDYALDAVMQGAIQTRSDRRTIITLEGEKDKFLARLNSHLRPEQASIQIDAATLDVSLNYTASGLEATTLQLTSQNFPVALVHNVVKNQKAIRQIDFPIAAMQLGGTFSSELNANLQTKAASGRLTVDNPLVGYMEGDRLSGGFYFGNKTLMLRDMAWEQNGGTYTVDSTIALPDQPFGKPSIQSTGRIVKGRIEDILVAMQIFDYDDFKTLGKLSLPDYFGRSRKFDNSDDLYNLDFLTSTPVALDVASIKVPPEPSLDIDPETREKYNCDTLLSADQPATPPALFTRGEKTQSFLEKIALLSCVKAQLALDVAEEKPFLPAELVDLQGEVNGTIAFSYDDTEGVQAEFDLSGGYQEIEEFGEKKIVGTPWQWGEIEMPQVTAKGVLRNKVLTFRPLGIRIADADGGGRISFIGSFGGETQTGQLRLTEVPTAFLEKFVSLPDAVDIKGTINGNAALAGTPENPSARGEMTMENASINDTAIAAVKGNFTYEAARLEFIVDSELVAESDPLKVTGSIPYQLPNATVTPNNNDLKLTFNLKDDGFILLNILSKGQLAWREGEGVADLTIDGTINPKTGRPTNLVATGRAAIAKAEIQAQALPDAPLTNVHGNIDFNFNSLTVRDFEGDFSGGKVSISGELPIARVGTEEQTLSVLLDKLDFSLPQLYRGNVNGNLIIAGTSLEPIIRGDVILEDGRIFLEDKKDPNTIQAMNPTQAPQELAKQQNKQALNLNPKNTTGIDLRAITQFKNLKITLGRNIQITRQPILNFLATGDLILNGTLDAPRPNGVIQLRRGQVNLFATQFRLDNGYRNLASFTPAFGLDPALDIILQTSLIETPRSSFGVTDPLSAEIEDRSVFSAGQLGAIETIRVQAKVQGRASELDDSVKLSSSPSRSEAELIALLGGTLLENFYGDDTNETLALANLAGSALLNSIQDAIGNAIGLSELRLFPTVITDEEKQESTLGLGAELSMDISPSFSFSLLQILNSSEATQFGLRYRVNDEIFVRGSTNLGDDNRITVEYDLKF